MHLFNRLSKKKASWEINVQPPSSIYPPCILWILNLRHEEKFIQIFFQILFNKNLALEATLKLLKLSLFYLHWKILYIFSVCLCNLCYLPSLLDFLAVSMSLSGWLLSAPLSWMLKQSMWIISSGWFLSNACSSWYWSFKVFLLSRCQK